MTIGIADWEKLQLVVLTDIFDEDTATCLTVKDGVTYFTIFDGFDFNNGYTYLCPVSVDATLDEIMEFFDYAKPEG